MRFDQASSGRQQLENTDKEQFRRQPQTEDNPSDMLTSVLEVKKDEENKVKFGKYKLPVENIADQARSTIRRQPSTSPAKKLLRRQPAAQHDYLKEIQDETAAARFLYQKLKSKNQFSSNCLDMKETFAPTNFFTPTELAVLQKAPVDRNSVTIQWERQKI